LGTSARSGSRSSPDGSAFTASRNRSNNSANYSTPADVFPGAAVLSYAFLFTGTVLNYVFCVEDVTPALDHH
jgi:hypothetical protein